MANEQQRVELFIIIEYLLEFTSIDEPLNQVDLINYAKNNYDVEIRRQRIPDMCSHLVTLTKAYPNKFPFRVFSFELGRETRYYGMKNILTPTTHETIKYALLKYPFGEEEEINELLAIIDKIAFSTLERTNNSINHYSAPRQARIVQLIAKLRSALAKKSLIEFSVKRDYELENDELIKGDIYRGYIVTLSQFNMTSYVAIYITLVHELALIRIDDLIINDIIDMEDDAPDMNELFKAHYSGISIEEYFITAKMPLGDGTIEDITFTFKNEENNAELITESLKLTFGRKVRYNFTLSADKQIGEIKLVANSLAFLIWATDYNIAPLINVTGNETIVEIFFHHYNEELIKIKGKRK